MCFMDHFLNLYLGLILAMAGYLLKSFYSEMRISPRETVSFLLHDLETALHTHTRQI